MLAVSRARDIHHVQSWKSSIFHPHFLLLLSLSLSFARPASVDTSALRIAVVTTKFYSVHAFGERTGILYTLPVVCCQSLSFTGHNTRGHCSRLFCACAPVTLKPPSRPVVLTCPANSTLLCHFLSCVLRLFFLALSTGSFSLKLYVQTVALYFSHFYVLNSTLISGYCLSW